MIISWNLLRWCISYFSTVTKCLTRATLESKDLHQFIVEEDLTYHSGKLGEEEHEEAGHCTSNQEAETKTCWSSACFLLSFLSGSLVHWVVLSIFRVELPISVKSFWKCPHTRTRSLYPRWFWLLSRLNIVENNFTYFLLSHMKGNYVYW